MPDEKVHLQEIVLTLLLNCNSFVTGCQDCFVTNL
jgi:hypothetical protein